MATTKTYGWGWVGLMAAWLLCTACSHEWVDEGVQPAANPVLRLDTKSISVDPANTDLDSLEVYVKTLRLAAFQGTAASAKCLFNTRLDDLSTYSKVTVGQEEYIEIPFSDLTDSPTIPAGELRLYAVANEEVESSLSLDNVDETALRNRMVQAKAGAYPLSAQSPFLMSADTAVTLLPAVTNPGTQTFRISLVRTVAKIGWASLTMNGVPVTDYTYTLSASGSVYSSFPLFEDPAKLTGSSPLSDAISTNAPLYIAEPVDGTVKLAVRVTVDEKQYTAEVEPNERITRNTCWQLEGKISQNCLLLEITVAPWEAVELPPVFE